MANRKIKPFHYDRCEEQPNNEPCICDKITEELEEAATDAMIKERKE